MKRENTIYALILVCTTFAALWALPALVHKATYSPDRYPVVYYSSVLDQFGLIDYGDKQTPLTDMEGNRYTAAQFDSLMPLLNYRQLMTDGRLPDSIGGYEVTPQLLRSTSFIFRYNPRSLSQPDPGLYILFESMPKRLGLEIPPDVMRLGKDVEFLDAETNSVDREKSDRFRGAFDKAGYTFPARWASGNPSPRKAYDEGYFSLDAAGRLYHIKMVNGRPYVRDTGIGQTMDILWFSIYEVANKRFYGFLFDREGNIHIIESDLQGGYETVRLDMDPIDPYSEQVSIMANLLYWTVTVTGADGCRYYALDNLTLGRVDTHSIARRPNAWDLASAILFPAYITLEHRNTAYVMPRLNVTGPLALGANLLAAVVLWLTAAGCCRKRIALTVYVLLTGLAGLLAVAVLPGFRGRRVHKVTNNQKLIKP